MALQGTYSKNGLSSSNAYARVETVSLHNKVHARAFLAIYAGSDYASDPTAVWDMVCVEFAQDASGASINAQAYAAAKTLDVFSGWLDC